MREVSFNWPAGKRAALSLTFDDARLSQVDCGLPILDRYGVRGTFYVSLPELAQRRERWCAALARGHEIGNHTVTHPGGANFGWGPDRALENFTLERMERELQEANLAIQELVGTVPVTFAYPCGQKFVGRGVQTESYVPLVARQFLAGRGYRDETANDPRVCDLAQLYGVHADGLSFEQLRPALETAAAQGRWLVLAAHEVGELAPYSLWTETLEQLCRYATTPAHGFWVDSVATIAGYLQQQRQTSGTTPPRLAMSRSDVTPERGWTAHAPGVAE